MDKEIRQTVRAFFGGMVSFATYPTAVSPRALTKHRRAGINRHFGKVCRRISTACVNEGASYHG